MSETFSTRLQETIQHHRLLLAELLIGVIALAVLFGPSLAEHARNAADPRCFNDDSRQQIWPLLRYHDPSLFQDDYVAQYNLAFPVPNDVTPVTTP